MISVNLALPQVGSLPPNLLWKGKPVYDPSKQQSFPFFKSKDSLVNNVDSHSDDLTLSEAQSVSDGFQSIDLFLRKVDGGLLNDPLHTASCLQSDGDLTPKIPAIVTGSDAMSGISGTEVKPVLGQDASPVLDWLLNPHKSRQLGEFGSGSEEQTFDRLLARLTQLEAHEENPHLKTDYRIAWLTVRFCQTGEAKLCTPQVLATYKVLGCHPDQVWFRIVQARNWVLGGPIKIGRVLPRYKTSALVAETGAAQSPLRPTATAPVPKKGKVA